MVCGDDPIGSQDLFENFTTSLPNVTLHVAPDRTSALVRPSTSHQHSRPLSSSDNNPEDITAHMERVSRLWFSDGGAFDGCLTRSTGQLQEPITPEATGLWRQHVAEFVAEQG